MILSKAVFLNTALFAFLFSVEPLAALGASQTAKRINSDLDESRTFVLKGNTRPVVALSLAQDQGEVPASQAMPRMSLHFTLTAAQSQLSDHMINAWANFARTGNPNGQGDAPWPRWQKGTDTPAYLLQSDGWKTVQTNAQFASAHNCSFWNTLLRYK